MGDMIVWGLKSFPLRTESFETVEPTSYIYRCRFRTHAVQKKEITADKAVTSDYDPD